MSEGQVLKFGSEDSGTHYEPRKTFNEIDVKNPIVELAGEAAENLPSPSGYKILIAIPRLKEATEGGIVKAAETLEREQTAMMIGFVISLGPDCYKDKERYPSGPWCKAGDFVLMRSYAGTRFMYMGQEYRMINEDVVEGTTPDPRGVTKAG